MHIIQRLTEIKRDAIIDSLLLSVLVGVPVFAVFVFLGPSERATATYFLVLLTAALSVASFSATTGILSFGHVAFMAVAAHVSALFSMPVAIKASALPNLPPFLADLSAPFLVALAIALGVCLLLAVLTGIPISRLGGSEASIATLALLLISSSVIIGARDFTRGSQALFGIPKVVTIPVAFAFAVAVLFIARNYASSRSGLLVRAVREDEPAAAAIGIRADHMRFRTWVLSGVLAGVAGVLIGHFLTVFSPKEFYFDLTFSLLVMLILGGFASISGAVLGAAIVTILIEVLRRAEQSEWLNAATGGSVFGLTHIGLSLAVLLMLYWRKDGLLAHRELSDWLQKFPRLRSKLPNAEAKKSLTQQDSGTLTVKNISKHYGGVKALENVDLRLQKGEILGLIGPNGSGKTTAMGCIAGTHDPTAGQVFLGDRDISSATAQQVARAGIGRTFQTIRLFHRLSVLENVTAAVASLDHKLTLSECQQHALHLLNVFGIEALASREASTLSYGQQRRLEIARAMALSPQYLLLDEPAAGMNDEESDELLGILQTLRDQHNIGILIIDHDLRLMTRLCDRIAVLNKGEKIAEGSPDAIVQNPEVLSAYLGT